MAERSKLTSFRNFLIVGSISTIANYLIFISFFAFGIQYILSSSIGYLSGVVIGYLLRKYLFKQGRGELGFIKFIILYSASLVLGLVLLFGLVNFGFVPSVAYIFSIILTTFTNLIGQELFLYSDKRGKLDFILYRYRYLIRYIVIGFGSLLIEVLFIEIVKKIFSIPSVYVILFGFLVGVVFSFILNYRINFSVSKKHNLRTFNIFLLISIFSFGLNLALLSYFAKFGYFNYEFMRFFTAGCIFMISYTLHRRITFVNVKNVGVAIYLNKSENIPQVKAKIHFYPDFIHMDLVDRTYNKNAKKVDLSIGRKISREWPGIEKMIHIMSKYPSRWINPTYKFVDWIIIHSEIQEDLAEVISLCKQYGKKVGVSISYDSNIRELIKYLPQTDMVQILGIAKPGESNQHLHHAALENLMILNSLKDQFKFDIGFDGGVKLSNIAKIDAKYVVSASTILDADDSRKAIYDLKTNSRFYTETYSDIQNFFLREIERIIKTTDCILSGTIVGSSSREKLHEAIGDIDLIIIVDKLSKRKFNDILSQFEKLREILMIDYNQNFVINSSFGPLKMNTPDNVVLHLMIYDRKGHKAHCLSSPFTCYDWQLSDKYVKEKMENIYKVHTLQPNFFLDKRRGLIDYTKDLKSNSISYREYKFDNKGMNEITRTKKMENRDYFEFSYHVMKFIMTNFVKMYSRKNFFTKNIETEYFKIYPSKKRKYQKIFTTLRKMKEEVHYRKWSNSHKKDLFEFLEDFQFQFQKQFGSHATRYYFMRHFKSEMNEASRFVGSISNPGIVRLDSKQKSYLESMIKQLKIMKTFSSPSRRALESAELLAPSSKIVINSNLSEINYGLVDGKTYDFLKDNFPNVVRAWDAKKDPRFPKGENLADVEVRLVSFLEILKKETQNTLIFTHNVILRCLLGMHYNIPRVDWYKINIPYGDPLEFINVKGRGLYPNLTTEQIEKTLGNVTSNSN
ncbi:MAG TPA: GtrA family protein [Patescibacteria group bacterium]|nr:GtrA family protein [Patescibacteria group bacterium]